MKTYLECWMEVAAALFSQALAGEPELVESLPMPLGERSFGYVATISGEMAGRFTVLLDGAILDAPLMGEGADQKAAWSELLREAADAAAGDLLAATGTKCQVVKFEEAGGDGRVSRAMQIRSGEKTWTLLLRDEVRKAEAVPAPPKPVAEPAASPAGQALGLELLLDVELDASLRFGSREMPLGEILDLGPGDVVELDRHVADPVDLIVGDKIVARGEVVLVNGNFGLRVTEVAAPRKRLESIRCLF